MLYFFTRNLNLLNFISAYLIVIHKKSTDHIQELSKFKYEFKVTIFQYFKNKRLNEVEKMCLER